MTPEMSFKKCWNGLQAQDAAVAQRKVVGGIGQEERNVSGGESESLWGWNAYAGLGNSGLLWCFVDGVLLPAYIRSWLEGWRKCFYELPKDQIKYD